MNEKPRPKCNLIIFGYDDGVIQIIEGEQAELHIQDIRQAIQIAKSQGLNMHPISIKKLKGKINFKKEKKETNNVSESAS